MLQHTELCGLPVLPGAVFCSKICSISNNELYIYLNMQFVAILVLFLACLSLRSISPLLAVPVGVGSKKPARYPRIQSLFTYSYVNSHGTTVTNHRLSHGWGCSEAAERSVAAPLGLRDSQGVDDNRSPNLYPWYSVIWYSHTLATWTIMNPYFSVLPASGSSDRRAPWMHALSDSIWGLPVLELAHHTVLVLGLDVQSLRIWTRRALHGALETSTSCVRSVSHHIMAGVWLTSPLSSIDIGWRLSPKTRNVLQAEKKALVARRKHGLQVSACMFVLFHRSNQPSTHVEW